MSGGFWSNLFSSSRERFSLEELQHLHSVLLRNQVVTDANRDVVVEALRSIAELVIWGEQHDNTLVEYFLTENLLAHFTQILVQRSNRSGNVATQVLQTLSILIQNIRNQQTIYYLFSNDHINNIAAMQFDFTDDEVLGYYVNLLKTISLRLNEDTVQFFFHEDGKTGKSAFPLYTEAIKFVAHRDGMVRAAVRTLTLNVYAIPLPSLRNFVCCPPASRYFAQLSAYAAERCVCLEGLLASWDVSMPSTPAVIESCLAEIEDLLSYCNDITVNGVSTLTVPLIQNLWSDVFSPLLFLPILQTNHQHEDHTHLKETATRSIGPLCALYILERLIRAFTDPVVLAVVTSILLGGDTTRALNLLPEDSEVHKTWKQLVSSLEHSPAVYRQAFIGLLESRTSNGEENIENVEHDDDDSQIDAQLASGTIRVLAALLGARSIPEEILEGVGLLPMRRRKQRELLQSLTLEEEVDTSTLLLVHHPDNGGGGGTSSLEEEKIKENEEQPQVAGVVIVDEQKEKKEEETLQEVSPFSTNQTPESARDNEHIDASNDDTMKTPRTTSLAARTNSSSSSQALAHDNLRSHPVRYSPADEKWPPSSALGAAASSTRQGEVHFDQLVTALLGVLRHPLMPSLALQTAGWLLNRLLSCPDTSSNTTQKTSTDNGNRNNNKLVLRPEWHQMLDQALQYRTSQLTRQLDGPWCDAIPPLISLAWTATRDAITHTGAGPLLFSVQTWLEGVLIQDLQWQLGGKEDEVSAANCAAAAKLAYQRTLAFLAVYQTSLLLLPLDIKSGSIVSGLGGISGSASTTKIIPLKAPVLSVDVKTIEAAEIKEGELIMMQPGEKEMWCSVAFAPGQEKKVILTVQGLLSPQLSDIIKDDYNNNISASNTTEQEDISSCTIADREQLLRQLSCAPSAVVMDAIGDTNRGRVVSGAPLLGASCSVDEKHPRWLHVEVRPLLSAFLRLAASSFPGTGLLKLDTMLIGGHWVLAFPNGESAEFARVTVEQAAEHQRQVQKRAMAEMLLSHVRSD